MTDMTEFEYNCLGSEALYRNGKKAKKNAGRCPIYVHHFTKIKHDPPEVCYEIDPKMYLNASECISYKQRIPPINYDTRRKHGLKTKHIKPSAKSVLDKLEETYWATWKPCKTEYSDTTACPPCSPIIKCLDNYTILNKNDRGDGSSNSSQRLNNILSHIESTSNKLTNSQEIQTEDSVIILSKIQENSTEKFASTISLEENIDFDISPIEYAPVNVQEETIDVLPEAIIESIAPKTDEDDVKVLKHTDSLILSKKKHYGIKERFQQPKCIRLYKKTTVSPVTTYLKGGSYPLKSCLKKESTFKGNFRLGQPGGSLVITTSSYLNKKYKKK